MAVDQVRIGVCLAGQPDDLAEWLADARAYEAAGAEALVVAPDPDARLDPSTLTAALAVLTSRCLLVTAPAGASTDALATLAQLSRGRLRLLVPAGADAIRLGRLPGQPTGPEDEQRWCPVPAPESRTAWRAALDATTANGHDGVIVTAGPRLLDILRNPDDPGERLDLYLAQG